MVSGIKLAVQGMTFQMNRQNQIANNLANQNTVGFKQSGVFSSTIEKHLSSTPEGVDPDRQIRTDELYIDYSEGALKVTTNDLDLAIQGTGFFSVLTDSGVSYTRDGSFSLDKDGFVVTSSGDKLLGEKGPIMVDKEVGKVKVFDRGDFVQDGVTLDSIRVVDFNKPYKMVRTGDNYFRPQLPNNNEVASKGFAIKQGYLEQSNVNTMQAMTGLISSYRSFEAISKALKSQDDTLDKSVNSVGRIG